MIIKIEISIDTNEALHEGKIKSIEYLANQACAELEDLSLPKDRSIFFKMYVDGIKR